MKNFKLPLVAFALLASNLIRSQTIYYTIHPGAWNDNTAWSTVGIGGTSCSCSPGCTSLLAMVYIGNSMTSSSCLSGIGSNAVITIESGDTLTITVPAKLPMNNSTINILSGGVMILNGEMDIAMGDTINNSGTLTVNGNVSDTGTGAYLTGTGVFGSTGTVTGTTVFVNPQGLWQAVQDTNIDTVRTNIVYNKGFVGIGTSNPTRPLHVSGSAIISDTLNVSAVQSHRIALFPGDSLIRFGDSSVVINMKNNNIYGELPCQPNCTRYTNIALGVNNVFQGRSVLSCAVGISNNIIGQNSMVMGIGNIAQAPNSITIGTKLINNISGSIIIGGYSSSIPALSIIPDITNHTPGFVGIGTETPDAVLNIRSNSSITNQLSITSSSEDVFTIDEFGNTYAAGAVIIGSGIHYNTPAGYGLYVGNGILASLVKIALPTDAVNWSDYVFANNYKLKPLTEVAQYIKENKHLPEVPSAQDVQKNGIDVAQMDATLVKKIEELTLYLIQQQKQSELQEKELQELKNQLESLKKVQK